MPDYLLLRDGVISREEKHVPYKTIQNVTVSQGIIERMFGLASVSIQNAAAMQMVGTKIVSSAIVIPGQTFAQANALADIFRSVTLGSNSSATGL